MTPKQNDPQQRFKGMVTGSNGKEPTDLALDSTLYQMGGNGNQRETMGDNGRQREATYRCGTQQHLSPARSKNENPFSRAVEGKMSHRTPVPY